MTRKQKIKVPRNSPAYYTPREVYGEIVKVYEPVTANPPFSGLTTADAVEAEIAAKAARNGKEARE